MQGSYGLYAISDLLDSERICLCRADLGVCAIQSQSFLGSMPARPIVPFWAVGPEINDLAPMCWDWKLFWAHCLGLFARATINRTVTIPASGPGLVCAESILSQHCPGWKTMTNAVYFLYSWPGLSYCAVQGHMKAIWFLGSQLVYRGLQTY